MANDNSIKDILLKNIDKKKEIEKVANAASNLPVAVTVGERDKALAGAHDALQAIINKGEDPITELTKLAMTAQNDKLYTALAQLIKSVSDAARISVEIDNVNASTDKLKSEVAQISKGGQAGGGNKTTNVFVGSTQDLLDMVNKTSVGNPPNIIDVEAEEVI